MIVEREEFVNAAPYESYSIRKDQCHGFKNKKLLTRCRELDLKVPQVSSSEFYPSCLDEFEKLCTSLALFQFKLEHRKVDNSLK